MFILHPNPTENSPNAILPEMKPNNEEERAETPFPLPKTHRARIICEHYLIQGAEGHRPPFAALSSSFYEELAPSEKLV